MMNKIRKIPISYEDLCHLMEHCAIESEFFEKEGYPHRAESLGRLSDSLEEVLASEEDEFVVEVRR